MCKDLTAGGARLLNGYEVSPKPSMLGVHASDRNPECAEPWAQHLPRLNGSAGESAYSHGSIARAIGPVDHFHVVREPRPTKLPPLPALTAFTAFTAFLFRQDVICGRPFRGAASQKNQGNLAAVGDLMALTRHDNNCVSWSHFSHLVLDLHDSGSA